MITAEKAKFNADYRNYKLTFDSIANELERCSNAGEYKAKFTIKKSLKDSISYYFKDKNYKITFEDINVENSFLQISWK